jgi:hypothetical protein
LGRPALDRELDEAADSRAQVARGRIYEPHRADIDRAIVEHR